MKMNLDGRVAKIRLPATAPNALWPLHEAIVNSIHAIEDAKRRRGRIDIRITRDKSQGVLRLGDGKKPNPHPIDSFTVEDNGIGFTQDNFDSFDESDTAYKKARGGQGVGRLMWLKAFSRVEIESVYDDGGERKRRQFEFTLKGDGVSKPSVTAAKDAMAKTTVRLMGFIQPYKDACAKKTDAIASCIVEHCLEFLALDSAPTIVLHDDDDGQSVNLNDWFNNEMKLASASTKFDIEGKTFNLNHFLIVRAGTDAKHQLHLCAHKRSVFPEALESRIPNLPAVLRDTTSGKPMVYTGYLSSDFLDHSVTPERTDFHRLSADSLSFDGTLTWDKMVGGAVQEAAKYLTPFTLPVKEAKEAQIRQYVETKAYQYRSLVKHRGELLTDIPPNLSEPALDLELYKRNQLYESEMRQRQHELLEEDDPTALEAEDYKSKFERFLEEWNDAGKSKLATYVAYRKAILSFLNDQLKRRADGKYHLEEDIHRIIFPLRATSDDVPADQMNLWIIDERLAYHRYLASDKYLDAIEPVEVDAHRRADLLIFDHPFAFAEDGPDFGAIVIVEFKRPMRVDYTEEENPIRQVFQYVRDIKAGKIKSRDGRPLTLRPNTPFYAYIICDLTERLKTYASDASLTPTPDAFGYFGYNSNYGVYVEVISFDKLVSDAQKRNAVFFEMLNLPKHLLDKPKQPVVPSAAAASASGNGHPTPEKQEGGNAPPPPTIPA